MRTLISIILTLGAVIIAAPAYAEEAAALPQGFPVREVSNYENLHAYFNFAPHTKANFTQQRFLPSGKVLLSHGVFEFRRGVGMLWSTEKPARTAMLITKRSITVYGSRGQELRSTQLEGSPSAKYTTVFLDGAKPDNLSDIARAFRVTCRESGRDLVLGLQARREGMDLRWLMVEVNGGNLSSVEYYSARQGRTLIRFSSVINNQQVPSEPFHLYNN